MLSLQEIETRLHNCGKLISNIATRKREEEIFGWLSKYPVISNSRIHLLHIIQDILQEPQCQFILDQGAAEGCVCRLLQDAGRKVFAMDVENAFTEYWDTLGIRGIVGNAENLNWWDGNKFDTIIATVWVTCKGKKYKRQKPKIEDDKIRRIEAIRQNWMEMLSDKGRVYFDIDTTRYTLEAIKKVFVNGFYCSVLMESPRLIIKLIKQ